MMILVVDANILFSALIAVNGKTFDLIYEHSLYAPEFLLAELRNHADEVIKKSGLVKEEYELFLALLSSQITFVAKNDFAKWIKKALKITPDPDDTEYIALALSLGCPIWSNDKKLKKQDAIKVFNTTELLRG